MAPITGNLSNLLFRNTYKSLSAFRLPIQISLPDPQSNLRSIRCDLQYEEMVLDDIDAQYINLRIKSIENHHQFWRENNEKFITLRESFVAAHSKFFSSHICRKRNPARIVAILQVLLAR
jgi:hypothetical protein